MSAAPLRALVVEDDRSWQRVLAEILGDMDLVVDIADSVASAVSCLRAAPHRLAVVDVSLEVANPHNQDGLAVLDAVARHDPGCVAVLLTGFATVDLAVNAITQHGAYGCLQKEAFRRAEFRSLVQRALALAPREPAAQGRHTGQTSPEGTRPPAAVSGRPLLVLLVEDDAGWRNLLVDLLAQAGHKVTPSASYGEALGWLRRQRFDLAVVDMSLASSLAPETNQDGYRVLASARAAAVPTIVVSGTVVPSDIERAYEEYGIEASLEKQAFDRELFWRAVSEVTQVAEASDGEMATLTGRERDVLKLLAQGMTNREIADALVISTNTVKRHLKSIFAKLGVSTRAAATARAMGARLPTASSRAGD
jgi:DNA-binding NarL/FixJ family response regulator